jgi:hypothetical protein
MSCFGDLFVPRLFFHQRLCQLLHFLEVLINPSKNPTGDIFSYITVSSFPLMSLVKGHACVLSEVADISSRSVLMATNEFFHGTLPWRFRLFFASWSLSMFPKLSHPNRIIFWNIVCARSQKNVARQIFLQPHLLSEIETLAGADIWGLRE